jgi:hypothetical protein
LEKMREQFEIIYIDYKDSAVLNADFDYAISM